MIKPKRKNKAAHNQALKQTVNLPRFSGHKNLTKTEVHNAQLQQPQEDPSIHKRL